MKIAVSSQCGLSITAFTTLVVQFSPWQKLYSGCSESSKRGVIHVPGGSALARMALITMSTDVRVGRPDVALLVLGGRVLRPGDAGIVQQVALGEEVEAGRNLLHDA